MQQVLWTKWTFQQLNDFQGLTHDLACSRAKCNITFHSGHVGVSTASSSHTAGTTNLNQIRRDWEFTRVRPISLHAEEHNYIHKGCVPSNVPGPRSRKYWTVRKHCWLTRNVNVVNVNNVKALLGIETGWTDGSPLGVWLTWPSPSTPSPARPQPAARPARWRAGEAGGHRPLRPEWIGSSRLEKLRRKGGKVTDEQINLDLTSFFKKMYANAWEARNRMPWFI